MYRKYVEKAVKAIDNLLKKGGLSESVRTWLTKAKTLITDKMFGKGSVSTKTKWLKKALASINRITKAQGSILTMIQESNGNSVFSSLKNILMKEETYKLYTKIVGSIDNLLNNNKLGSLAKTWLTKAKELVNTKITGNEADLQKKEWLETALNSINEAEKEGATIQSLAKQSITTTVFSSLLKLIKDNSAYKLYENISSLIKGLTEKEETEEIAQEWLTSADDIVDDIINSNKSDTEKETMLKEGLSSIEAISRNNVSILSLSEQTSGAGIFSSLSNILKDNATYKMYVNYVAKSLNLINTFLKDESVRLSFFKTTWLNNAANLINEVIRSNESDTEKETKLSGVLTSITEIAEQNVSADVIEQESNSNDVFSSLKTLCQVYKEYAEEGFEIIFKLTKNLRFWNVTLDTAYEQFVNFGVTKFQLYRLYKMSEDKKIDFLSQINNGENFINCGEVALASYLNMNRGVISLQHVASDIAGGACYWIGDWALGEQKVLRFNGHKNAKNYECSFENLMTGLKEGDKVILRVDVYGDSSYGSGTDHSITISVENDNMYGVCDIMINKGNKILYTADEFNKLMSGDKNLTATGQDEQTGKTIQKKINYKAVNNGQVFILTDAAGVAEKAKVVNEGILQTTTIYDVEYHLEQVKSYMDALLSKTDLKETVRTWLNEINSSYLYTPKPTDGNFFERVEILSDLKKVLPKMLNEDCSVTTILDATFPYGIKVDRKLTPFTKFLEDDIEYKIYMKYKDKNNGGRESTKLINGLSEKLNLSPEIIFEQFVELGMTTSDIHGAYRCFEKVKNEEDFVNAFIYGNSHGYSNSTNSNPQRISEMMAKLIEIAGLN